MHNNFYERLKLEFFFEQENYFVVKKHSYNSYLWFKNSVQGTLHVCFTIKLSVKVKPITFFMSKITISS